MAGSLTLFWLLPAILTIPLIAFLPHYLVRLHPEWIRSYFQPVDRQTRALESRADVRKICARLTELGFHSLGVKVERRPLFGRTRALVFASTQDEVYASVFRFEWRTIVQLFTPLEPGVFVLTSNGRGKSFELEGYIRVLVRGGTVDELLAAHQDKLRELTVLGYRPNVQDSRESRLASDDAYYCHHAVRRSLRAQVRGVWAAYLAALITGGRAISTLFG